MLTQVSVPFGEWSTAPAYLDKWGQSWRRSGGYHNDGRWFEGSGPWQRCLTLGPLDEWGNASAVAPWVDADNARYMADFFGVPADQFLAPRWETADPELRLAFDPEPYARFLNGPAGIVAGRAVANAYSNPWWVAAVLEMGYRPFNNPANYNPYGSPANTRAVRAFALGIGLTVADADQAALQRATEHLEQYGQYYSEATSIPNIGDEIAHRLARRAGVAYAGLDAAERTQNQLYAENFQTNIASHRETYEDAAAMSNAVQAVSVFLPVVAFYAAPAIGAVAGAAEGAGAGAAAAGGAAGGTAGGTASSLLSTLLKFFYQVRSMDQDATKLDKLQAVGASARAPGSIEQKIYEFFQSGGNQAAAGEPAPGLVALAIGAGLLLAFG